MRIQKNCSSLRRETKWKYLTNFLDLQGSKVYGQFCFSSPAVFSVAKPSGYHRMARCLDMQKPPLLTKHMLSVSYVVGLNSKISHQDRVQTNPVPAMRKHAV